MAGSIIPNCYAILGNWRLRDEFLQTTFFLVQSTSKIRPITWVSTDSVEIDVTPNHFFFRNRTITMPSPLEEENFDHCKRYAQAQCYADPNSKTCVAEFVSNLNHRSKWSTPAKAELKSGDPVWIANNLSPRGVFPMGRIENLRYSGDGFALLAEVKKNTGKYIRPVVKPKPF